VPNKKLSFNFKNVKKLLCKLPELVELEEILKQSGNTIRSRVIEEVSIDNHTLPIHCLYMGSQRPELPVLGFFSGVHGIERIGTQILLSFIRSLVKAIKWDPSLAFIFERINLIFVPIINPTGMWKNSRCNSNGIDLMRNSPINAETKAHFMVGGHRFTRLFPWYRGIENAPVEKELQAVINLVRNEFFNRPMSLMLDCHSGFGIKDRIWFPYAYTHRPAHNIGYLYLMQELFDQAYPNHSYYLFEPQSTQYLTHGDLWDYLYESAYQESDNPFLPLTLEMGSWAWVKKNPRQMLRYHGIFNPVLPHRHQRVLRRHLIFFNFLVRLTCGYKNWQPDEQQYEQYYQEAINRWYQQ
jgi:hypothetical protein